MLFLAIVVDSVTTLAMIDAAYILAWMGIVLLQAVAHYSVSARKRFDPHPLEATEDVCLDEVPPREQLASSIDEQDERSDEDLDGEEFDRLLSQTGSEMMNVSTIFFDEESVSAWETCLVRFLTARNLCMILRVADHSKA